MLLCLGPFVVDHLAFPDGSETRAPGGNGLLVACTLARGGVHVSLAGILGDDAGGQLLRRTLADGGVDLCLLETAPGLPTKTCPIRVAPDGTWTGSTPVPFFHPYLSRPFFGVGDGLHVAGANSLLRAAPDALGSTVADARQRGVPVSWGLNRLGDEDLQSLVRSEDLVFCNAAERGAVPIVNGIVSHGAEGVEVIRAGRATRLPAVRVQAVNTVGAGDVLSAVTLAGVRSGDDLLDAARAGIDAAARSVTRRTWLG